jgi:hypothetical protein
MSSRVSPRNCTTRANGSGRASPGVAKADGVQLRSRKPKGVSCPLHFLKPIGTQYPPGSSVQIDLQRMGFIIFIIVIYFNFLASFFFFH